MSKPSDLVQGTLDILILKILALEPQHGWAIGLRLRQVSGDVLQVSDGSLYPALHKLENEGWITAEERRQLEELRAITLDAISVDDFEPWQLRAASFDPMAALGQPRAAA